MAAGLHDPAQRDHCARSWRETMATASVGKGPLSKDEFLNRFAVVLTVVSLSLLGLLSLVFGESRAPAELEQSARRLDENKTDFSTYSCHYIYDEIPDAGAAQCRFAKTCNQGVGLWAPSVFCSSYFSTFSLTLILSPVILIWMILLFRMLGSTAEDFFSPALEMFSVKLGLPPRFAGVTLLALGNGAADVSATISAIANDPQNGYKLSLGALTGAAMVIGGVISAVVVIVADGVPCRGALVRDVTALLLAVVIVWRSLGSSGQVTPEIVSLFLTLYFTLVVLVLIADTYHRAVVVPRMNRLAHESERQRQMEESERVEQEFGNEPDNNDGDRILSMITALSNYDNPGVANQAWAGVDSSDLAHDRPVMLHGSHGILSHHEDRAAVPSTDDDYQVLADNACAEGAAYSASNWSGAVYDGQKELKDHFSSVWEDIAWNGDIGTFTKILLMLEWPFTTLRQCTVPIPCDGYYNRALVALSLASSPLWFAYYLYDSHDIRVWASGGYLVFGSFWLTLIVVAVAVLRLAPGGEGPMKIAFATPIAFYGFIIGATWIDIIADSLVSLLDFVGIVLRIPGPIVGLTILAWGNSMGDLSANVTMARKGLANMAVRIQ